MGNVSKASAALLGDPIEAPYFHLRVRPLSSLYLTGVDIE